MTPQITGFLINSALFLGGLLLAGLMGHYPIIVALALASIGSCAICYAAQIYHARMIAAIFMGISWLTAVYGAAELMRSYFG